ncbi:MAG: redoxin domain-containing protein, partial [Anaerolineae bacterium]|nr:redoxin domain-containing protein [Anaerolineae bacterium]
QPLAIVLACTELAIAVLLAVPPAQPLGAIGALVLLLAFTLALAAQLLRGKHPTCACFGSLSQAAISWRSVARNGVLMALAGGLMASPQTGILAIDFAALPALIALSWAALATLWLFHLTRQNGRLLLRIEQLEHNPTVAPSTEPTPQPQPLQVGAPVPPLNLSDARGRPFDVRGFRGKPVLLLFLDAGCSHCRSLLAQLRDVPLAASDMAVVVVSENDQLRPQLPAEATLLIDPSWSGTTPLFGLRGTPAAVWIDEEGALSQAAVHGTSAVSALMALLLGARQLITAKSAPSNAKIEEARHELAPV